MAFCFKKRESVVKAVRRLGCERIEHALECLKDCDRAEAIHGARKEIKKVRAVLRLVRAQIRKKDWCRSTGLLRDAANPLAAPRDAYVKVKTVRNLRRHFKGQLAPGALRHIRAHLRNVRDEEMKRFENRETVRCIQRTLRRLEKEMERLHVNGKGWNALCPGVRTAYSEGQRAYQTVRKHSSPENLHRWRKRAKDLWYQVTLLGPLWPEQMEATARELEALGEYLGDDHDLVMLRQEIEKVDSAASELETLKGLIDERQCELRSQALALASRFYTEKPSAFSNRLARYWQIWRHEKAAGLKRAETAA